MEKPSSTYRILAIITIVTVIGNLSLPACLYAKDQISGPCPMASVHHAKSMKKMMGSNAMQKIDQYRLLYRSQQQDMNSTMACCLNPDLDGNRPFFKVETVASAHTQAAVLLQIVTFDFTAESESVDRPYEIPPPNLKAPPPPTFLVNCTFLN